METRSGQAKEQLGDQKERVKSWRTILFVEARRIMRVLEETGHTCLCLLSRPVLRWPCRGTDGAYMRGHLVVLLEYARMLQPIPSVQPCICFSTF
ncbi:hypothetical protein IF1G_10276 [Cordyceps javanica]|uniref:Uncharacterized protein n=1 Tax=Cordyceps javanica TaxID=43265 RepID=A0A545UNL8_9HYPO|nr:hypothetical protein IF1G_10276 [Cordyceps javanica]